jgi:hypothetical protein
VQGLAADAAESALPKLEESRAGVPDWFRAHVGGKDPSTYADVDRTRTSAILAPLPEDMHRRIMRDNAESIFAA